MKTQNILVPIFIFFMSLNSSIAQLGPGALAFTGFNSNNPDGFSIIALDNIPSGTVIKFTDNGWKESGTFRTGEGTITWTSPQDLIPAGTIISFYDSASWTTSAGSSSGGITLASGTDQILAYTGYETEPSFLAAVQFNSNSDWNSDATSTGESSLPAGLTADSTALALSALDNSVYIGSLEGTKTEILKNVNNPDNWYSSNYYHINLNPGLFPYNVITTSGDWHLSSNWTGNRVPDGSESAIIAEDVDVHVINSDAACKNLFVEPRGTVVINSGLTVVSDLYIHSRSSTYAGQIVNYGTISVSGTTTYERWIPGNDWHIVSSPVIGQALNDFVLTNSIQYFQQGENYDLAPYSETSDNWTPYTTAEDNNSMIVGKGYAMRRDIDEKEGIVSFTGTLNQSEVQVTLTRSNNGWNCLGNPFVSALKGTGTVNSFLANNIDMLDPEFTGLYLWDYNIDDYRVYVNSDNEEIAPCQGFIVRARNGGEMVTIGDDLQVFASPSFKSSEIPWPAIALSVSRETDINTTRFVFNDEMTTGFDPAYDAGKLKGNPSFALYSHLMEEEAIDLAVQALPLLNHKTFYIPVGLDCEEGGYVTFSAVTEELPTDMQVILKDIQADKSTNLGEEGTGYTTFVDAGTTGTGRFYLLTGSEDITQINSVEHNKLRINVNDKNIEIHYPEIFNSEITLYNMAGQICEIDTEINSNKASINATNCPRGIYILKLKSKENLYTQKIILY